MELNENRPEKPTVSSGKVEETASGDERRELKS